MGGSVPTAFVLLPYGLDADRWHDRWRKGELIGLNEPYPYGYFHAQAEGVRVLYGRDAAEGGGGRLWRLGWRAILGFDLIHAWRNRRAFFEADAVWTHLENQSLAASMLCALFPRRRRPKLILQSVWLMDDWDGFGPIRKWFWRRLLSRADILSFLSPLNHARASEVFPGLRCEMVFFGIRDDEASAPRASCRNAGLNLLALGSDQHRDWPTLIQAVAGMPDTRLRIVSGSCPAHLAKDIPNVTIERLHHNDALTERFREADALVIPLRPNLHVSGITVALEGVLNGLTVIASRAGGLEAYFDDSCLLYVPPGDVAALREAIAGLRADPDAALQRARNARVRQRDAGFDARTFARQHALWTNELLGRAARPAATDRAWQG